MTHRLVDEDLLRQNILTDAAIRDLAGQGIIFPFDPASLSGCSYDLRVGRLLRSRNKGRTFDLEKSDYHIESGECVTVVTLEELNFSDVLLFGVVANKHSMLARGIVHPITKVDPGFKGPLAVTLFNHGHVAEPIQYKQRLVALIIKPLSVTPQRVYGVSQLPSYRQGDIDIASIINEPAEPLGDDALARMYGRPVARLYERVAKVEQAVEAGLIKKTKEKRDKWVDIGWRFIVALTGAAAALTGKYVFDNWNMLTG